MTKRIPQLPLTGTVGPNDLLEMAVVDNSSPTGYTSHSVRASLLKGTAPVGDLPFRYTFEGEVDLDYYAQFSITFPYTDLYRSATLDGEGASRMGAILYKIQMSALLAERNMYGEETDYYNVAITSTCDVNYSANAGGYARLTNILGGSESYYQLPTGWFNNFAESAVIYPSATEVFDDSSSEGQAYVQFQIASPYMGNGNGYTKIKFKGYADITPAFFPNWA